MSDNRINPNFIHRQAWGNPLQDALHSHSNYLLVVLGSCIVSFIWPLALPLCLLVVGIAALGFSSQRWRCPMRAPLSLNIFDPSEDRKVRRSLFSFWPSFIQYESIQQRKGRGIFFIGFQRGRDIGRELWLSIDDLTRHVMFFASTGGGKTETVFSWMINSLCWGRGFTIVDGKAQNDTTRTICYLARRFGREDDIEVINFMNGGKSLSEIILTGDKNRPQSNTWNPFCYSTEAFVAETMQSMLPTNVQGGEWQSRAIAMNKALVFGTKFYCVRENKTMSLQMLREHMTLEKLAGLYCRAVDEQWPEDAVTPLRNYLQDVPGFDMAQARTPGAWTEEPRKQHAYLSGQFSETLSTFTETFGSIFAQDAGDIDLRDSIHSDRILVVMIPAMDTSSHTTSALGRMFVTQQSMILARDLGYRIEGRDHEALEVTKYKGRFPYISFLDEVGAYYTSRIAVQATQVRSLDFSLIMMGQDQERIEDQTSAANVATLMQNAGTKIAGRVVSDDKTARTVKNAAGEEARARMTNLQRRDDFLGTSWIDGNAINIQMESKINVQDLIQLQPGEFFTIFQGTPIASAAFHIPDEEKTTKNPVVINRLVTVDPPRLDRLRRLLPRTAQRRVPTQDNVSTLIGVLTAEPSRRQRKVRTDPCSIIDTFQQRLANRQAALGLNTDFDLDFAGRENALWETALQTIRTTTRAERKICYITLNKPIDKEQVAPNIEADDILQNLIFPDIQPRKVATPQQDSQPEHWDLPDIPDGIWYGE
ncbi:conjugal transfer protein TrbC [Salmonella enterica subsp. enterica]|nr:TraM recognition domain-containing protein [Salmonella enterica subsp. enterica]MIF52497.1 conjugal transfer protein TrbC [Salmonella enterica subsp. enterica]